jgi:hypothetical protein
MSQNHRPNWTYVVTVVIVYTFMFGAAAISFGHIVDVSHTLGLGIEAWTVPFFIDGIALLGKIGRLSRFTHETQHAGLTLMVGAGVLSLTCNVMAGDNLGQQLYGVLVVAAFVTTEWYAKKLQPAPRTVIEVADEVKAKRHAAAVKGAATRKANRAAAPEGESSAYSSREDRGAQDTGTGIASGRLREVTKENGP